MPKMYRNKKGKNGYMMPTNGGQGMTEAEYAKTDDPMFNGYQGGDGRSIPSGGGLAGRKRK